MKIIIANKYLYPRGGDCLYTLRLMKLLSDAGHTVIPFTMDHPQNIKTDYDKYFVPHIDFREELKKSNIGSALRVASRAIVNRQAANLLEKMIEDFRPDIIHLNNIHHQLTPAILEGPVKHNIPVVWTLHDYILNCPDNTFLRKGKPCTKCADGNNIYSILHRCKKGSLAASIIAAIECSIYNQQKLARIINRFITPSQFMANILVEHSLPSSKVTHIPNFLPSSEIESDGGDYFLYFGRLSVEKGVDTLLKAFKKFSKSKLIIAGDGPDRLHLENEAKHLKLADSVKFVGHKSSADISQLLSDCIASIVPSISYENFPYSILETMAAAKPVIASRIGGIPEQVENNITGFIFEAGNIDELTHCMTKIYDNRNMAVKMGQAGQYKVKSEYSPETYYKRILKVYRQAIDNKHKNSMVLVSKCNKEKVR